MNRTLLHRISTIQTEMESELDLRALAEQRVDGRELLRQCAASGQMDPRQRYEHERAGEILIEDPHAGVLGSALDREETELAPSADLPWGWIPDRKPRAWTRFWLYLAAAGTLFALAAAWPFPPFR
jgi:hypothetical protein